MQQRVEVVNRRVNVYVVSDPTHLSSKSSLECREGLCFSARLAPSGDTLALHLLESQVDNVPRVKHPKRGVTLEVQSGAEPCRPSFFLYGNQTQTRLKTVVVPLWSGVEDRGDTV